MRIPALGVVAPVVPVRIADGTALLTAHTVHTGGGAFDELGNLAPGSRFTIETTTGARAYVVESVEPIDKDELARRATRQFDQSVPGRLALVTCTDWDGRQYLSNTVVLATPL